MRKLGKAVALFAGIASLFLIAFGIREAFWGDSFGTALVFLTFGVVWVFLSTSYYIGGIPEDICVKYYDEHAVEYVEATANIDLSRIRNRFLNSIRRRGYLLDWGCGSGRDTKAFKEFGYRVDAVDASEAMCKAGNAKMNVPISCKSFSELNELSKYDGVWANASLMHIRRKDLTATIELGERALVEDGVMYLSFKHGDFEGEKNGRYYTYMNKALFDEILKKNKRLKLIDIWFTIDKRDGGKEDEWMNILVRKVIE